MNENLSEMVKDPATEPAPAIFQESDLDLPETEEAVEAPVDERQLIGITSFSSWFAANADQFTNINRVNVAIRGVNPDQTLIMAVSDDSGE